MELFLWICLGALALILVLSLVSLGHVQREADYWKGRAEAEAEAARWWMTGYDELLAEVNARLEAEQRREREDVVMARRATGG